MSERSTAFTGRGPVGAVILGSGAVGIRAGENVMSIGRVAAAVHDLTLLGDRRLFREVVLVAVEIGDALRDRDSLRVVPGTVSDAVLRVHAARSGRAEISAPGFASGAD